MIKNKIEGNYATMSMDEFSELNKFLDMDSKLKTMRMISSGNEWHS